MPAKPPTRRTTAAITARRSYVRSGAIALGIVLALAGRAHALDFYVDQATGRDSYSAVQAQSPATPWQTIGKALSVVATGHTIRVRPGVYQQSLQSRFAGVRIVADGARNSVVIAPPAASTGLAITHHDLVVEGLLFRGGVHGIRAEGADGLVIRGCSAVAQSANGFTVVGTTGATIENSIAASAGSRGILLDHTAQAYVRNNLVYDAGEWGIGFENAAPSGAAPALSTGNVVAFNTVAFNGGGAGGGLRLRNAIAEIRDNVLASNAPYGLRLDTIGAAVHHNLISGSGNPLSPPDYVLGPGSLGADPLFVAPRGADGVLGGMDGFADDDFSLAQNAAGQTGAQSPAVDAGSGDVAARDIGGSTRSDGGDDAGIADLGFHANAPSSTGIPAVPTSAATYFVDAALGDDTRTKVDAQSPATPWRTIGRALQPTGGARPRDTVLVAAGTYAEAVKTSRRGVRLQALGDVVVTPPAGAIGIQVDHARVFVEGFTVVGGLHGIRATSAKGVVIRDCKLSGQSGNGIMVVETKRALVDGNRISDAGLQGILLKSSERSYVRNNVVVRSAEWGIHVDNGDPPLPRKTGGDVVAFNTVYANGRSATAGGIRFQNATGEIRDNIVAGNRGSGVKTDTAPTLVHHNDVVANALPFDTKAGQEPAAWANLAADPGFVAAATDDFRLQQAAAGEASTSACVDAGSGAVGSVDISGSTRSDGAGDTGVADLGHHDQADDVPRTPPPPAPTPTATPAPTPSPSPSPTPGPGGGAASYVDCSAGDDTRTRVQAQSPATPWRTIQHAADASVFGDVVVVAPGTCKESVEIDHPGLTFRAATPLAAIVVPPAGSSGFDVQANDVTLDGFLIRASFQGVLVAASKSSDTIQRVVLRGLVVKPRAGGTLTTNGIQVRDAAAITVDSCVVTGAAQQGILLKRVQHGYVRNNLVYVVSNDWGISFDNTATGPLPPLSTGNVAAFNTVSGCGAGLRFVNSAGELRENVLAFNATTGLKFDQPGDGSVVHHNDAFGNTTDYDRPSGFQLWVSNLSVEPKFVDRAAGSFALRQEAAGQAVTSPLVDAGTTFVAGTDISGSTRSDGVADADVADLGYHAGASASASPAGGPGPSDGSGGATLYVDCARGDDRRSKLEAGSATSPLLTITRALALATAGDAVVVQPGTCTSPVTIDVAGVTLRAASPLTTALTPPAGAVGLAVRASNVSVDGFVVRSTKEGVVVAAKKSGDVLSRVRLRGLRVEAPGSGTIATNGIRAQDSDRVRIESCSVDGADQQGIVVKRGSRAWVRNNLVTRSGEWGIHVDNGDPPAPATIAGQIVAFNTVAGSGRRTTAGGIRFQNATGEIRDNVLAGNAGSGVKTDQGTTVVHHNLVFASALAFERVGAPPAPLWSNVLADPLFSDAASRDYTLQQSATGQTTTSPAVDAGSGGIGERDISGSTRRDGVADTGTADLGYHAGADPLPAVPAIATPPGSTSQRTFHVDAAAGDDARSVIDAQDASKPWRTIGRALATDAAAGGDTVLVAGGTYTEAVQTTKPGVTLRALGAAVIVPPAGGPGIEIAHGQVTVEGFTVRGGLHGIRAENAAAVVVRGCTLGAQSGNGIFVVQSDGATIDGNRVDGAGAQGIVVKRAGFAYVRNNLVTRTADWGIQIDNGDTPLPPVTGGHVLAFNTVYGCGGGSAASGGIRLQNATGEVRDNVAAGNVGSGVKTDTAPTVLHHNAVSGSVTRFDTKTGAEPFLWANVTIDPLLGDPANGDFTLREAAAGQSITSPAVDTGSGTVAERDISGSTRSDGVADAGIANIGYHAAATSSGPRPSPVPTPSTTPIPPAGSGVTFYVDPVAGDDTRNTLQAQSPGSGWKSIARAILGADPGDVILLAPGTYAEAVEVTRNALTLRGAGTLGDVVLTPPPTSPGVLVNGRLGVHLENLVVQGGPQGVLASNAAGLALSRVAIVAPATNGIQLTTSDNAVIDGSIVTGAGTQGILLRQSGNAYVRNNLIYTNTEWAITFDNSGSPLPAPVTGNVVAFNTVHANGKGIRMLNASGEIRDNQITSQVDIGLYLAGPNLLAHHNNFSANGRDRDQESAFAGTIRVWASLGANPRYVKPAGNDGILGGAGWKDDDFHLRQLAGQTPVSPMVDAGSGAASALDISGSTRSDGVADSGVADVGVHAGAAPATTPPPFATAPASVQWTYYVDAASGSDARTRATARTRGTAWQTIGHALQQSGAGDTIVVLPGTYAESVQVQAANVTLVAETPGSVVVAPPAQSSVNGFTVEKRGATIDGFVVRGATNNGISVLSGVAGTAIRNCAILGAGAEGIRALTLDDILVQDSLVIGGGSSGILLRQVTNATVRNNLVYDNFEWGISIDNSAASGPVPAVATGELVERNTSAFNGLGNLRLANARGTVRDNLLTDTQGTGLRIDTAGSTLLDNGFFATARDIDPDRYIIDSCTACAANLRLDPAYLNSAGNDGVRGGAGWADDDFRLAQTSAGQPLDSAAVDAGSASAVALSATGTTASNGQPDTGVVDLGFHYASSSRAIAPLVPVAASAATVASARAAAPATAAAQAAALVTHALPAATPTPVATPRPSATPAPFVAPRAAALTPAASSGATRGIDLGAGSGTMIFVDAAHGDDARSVADARSAATPFRSIARALASVAPGGIVAIAPGSYAENVVIATPRITLRGAGASVRITPADAGQPAVRVRGARDVTVQGLEVVGGAEGIVATGDVGGLRIVDVAVAATGGDGIVLGAAAPVTIERCTVTGAAGDGIVARRTHDLLLYDVLAYANTGAGLRLGHADTVARFVTLYANHAGARVVHGKLQLHDAIVSDNVAAGLECTAGDTAKIMDTHFWQNGIDLDPPTIPVGPGARFGERPLRADAGPDGVLGGAGWADDVFTLDMAQR